MHQADLDPILAAAAAACRGLPTAAADAVYDRLIDAVLRQPADSIRSPAAFCATVAGWRRRDWYAKQATEWRRLCRLVADFNLDRHPKDEPLPPDIAQANEEVRVLHEFLAALPTRERTVVDLHFLQGMTHDEIATTIGCPRGTVQYRITSSLRRLRQMFDAHDCGAGEG